MTDAATSSPSGPADATDGRALADAVFGQRRQALATVLALLEETNLRSLLVGRARELASSNGATFQRDLAMRAEVLALESAAELGLRLIGELNALLCIQPRHYVARRDFEDNALEIVHRACEVLRSYDKEFQGSGLRDLVEFQMRRVLGELGKAFADLPRERQQDFVHAIRRYVESLPTQQQERLRRELGADELTDETIRRALASGALGAAFAGVVAMAGFAFYTGATSLFATLAAAAGVTLPFGFYTGLTSLIAVLANPVFLVLAVGGGGFWFYRRQDEALRQRLVPLVVAQLAVAGMAATGELDTQEVVSEAITRWSDARASWDRQRQRLTAARAVLAEAENARSETADALKVFQSERKALKRERDAARESLRLLVRRSAVDIATGRWGAGLMALGDELRRALDGLEPAEPESAHAWLGGIPRMARRALDLVAGGRAVDQILTRLVDEAACVWRSSPEVFETAAARCLGALADLEGRVAALDARAARLRRDLKGQSARVRDCEAVVSAAEATADELGRRYPGLGECP